MTRFFIFLFAGFFSLFMCSQAQVTLDYTFPDVIQNGRSLDYGFAGGLNSSQYQTVDLDLDGDQDLVIFDRSSDMILCFQNKDDSYSYSPVFASMFPEDIQHWVVLADYNCDGKNDLFTATTSGVRVFENTSDDGILSWELVADPLLTEGVNGPVNILFNPTDIPSITDQDGDGDLDMLFFNFSDGDHIEFHQNMSVENGAVCGLDYVRVSSTYGDVDACDCDNFEFQGNTCHEGGKVLHVAGKALLSYDHNQNGAMDLVVSQEHCPNLSYLPNAGMTGLPDFSTSDNTFPGFSAPISNPTFPAAYYLDVTFDGIKDLLVAQNVRDNHHGEVNFTNSSFLYENTGNNVFSDQKSFLQEDMIDVGSMAYPSWADIDGDGLDDLVISGEEGRLYCYLQTASGFKFMSDDLFGISGLQYVELKIQFLDLNADGKKDLAMGVHSHMMNHSNYFYYWLNKSEGDGISIELDDKIELPIQLDRSDDFFMTDLDNDGNIDLLVANVFGELNYHRNLGDQSFDFVLEESNLLNSESTADNANLSITVGDLNLDGKNDLVTTRRNGRTAIYFDFPDNKTAFQSKLIDFGSVEDLTHSRFGRRSKPALGLVKSIPYLTIGTYQGGVQVLKIASAPTGQLSLSAFPNPSPNNFITFNLSAGNGVLQIVDLSGKIVSASIPISSEESAIVDLSLLNPGLYIARTIVDGKNVSQRIKIVSD